ncbi:S-adenosyl-L-methionine-dependent methyltransferase [Aspergillus avenaceus]|uniref:S-adenosyl-L-methionine-dependent methyltransferase n=1 Tax=Aspergillus avenaceus TaxID=36643 RepID=A0A5N6U1G8_ASPAV|nr:S-adenosyl-L-methionine-dependent methyltransferase [Aspergillus avenaceus]
MAPNSDQEPLINSNPELQSYYQSLESRIGYRLFLGGTRHFGFYDKDTWWPFPISKALRAMEDRLATSLDLPPGAYVLDAGCGVGHVALRLATQHGFRIQGIDVIDHHLDKARQNIARSGLPDGQIAVRKTDYHHLETFEPETFDGVYTMETFVHATDPEAVLAGFFHVLRPGGRLTLFEYDHVLNERSPASMVQSMQRINKYAAMPTNSRSHPGVFRQMLEDAGFTDIVVRDHSENITPMTRLFYLIAYVPFLFVRLFGLERYFINTVAGVESYRGRKHWRFLGISATKPGTFV